MGSLHKSTKRDYLGRVNDKEYPKAKAAELAKKFDYDYWDGDRRICYGGYKYIEGRWSIVAQNLINHSLFAKKVLLLFFLLSQLVCLEELFNTHNNLRADKMLKLCQVFLDS